MLGGASSAEAPAFDVDDLRLSSQNCVVLVRIRSREREPFREGKLLTQVVARGLRPCVFIVGVMPSALRALPFTC